MQVILVTGLSQTKLVSIQVGLSMTLPSLTDTLLPPPSRFCVYMLERINTSFTDMNTVL